ncbi:hypothetical protein AAZX31_17G083500 [Glycine max]
MVVWRLRLRRSKKKVHCGVAILTDVGVWFTMMVGQICIGSTWKHKFDNTMGVLQFQTKLVAAALITFPQVALEAPAILRS